MVVSLTDMFEIEVDEYEYKDGKLEVGAYVVCNYLIFNHLFIID